MRLAHHGDGLGAPPGANISTPATGSEGLLRGCPQVNASPSGGGLLRPSLKAVRNDLGAGGNLLLISGVPGEVVGASEVMGKLPQV